jgi:hypothetical protein
VGDIVRADANGRENIWLRQSVTFTVDGQARTLEVGIPLPPGATAEDVEALLNEADAGMARISRYLDERVAAQLGTPLPAQAPATTPQRAAAEAAPAATSIAESRPSVADEEAPEPPAQSAPETQQPVAAPAPKSPTAPPAAPARQTPAPAAPRPAPAASAPAPRPGVSGPRNAKPTAPLAAGEDMTRPQFIAALGELGLNPKQAMDRLGVRSLEGLNLREALETLRRQLVQDAPAEPGPEPAFEADHAEPEHEPAAPAAEPRYFEEEEDGPDLAFTVDEASPEDEEEEFGTVEAAAEAPDEDDELDLEDVPDFAEPPAAPAATRAAKRAASARASEAESAAPAQAVPSALPSAADRARAMQLVGKLRSARGGGPATEYQRKAYHNLVEGQLGADDAAQLVRGLWRMSSERLTADQLDALIRWGKEDAFLEEAALVLATLRAEQARAANGAAAERAPASTTQRPARGAGAASARQGGAR